MFVNGPGRDQFIDQVVRVLLLSEEGRRRKLTETEAYKNQLMYSAAGILASHTDEDIKRKISGDEALLKAYYEAHNRVRADSRAPHPHPHAGLAVHLAPGQKDLTDAEALAKALEIRQKIVQGADFADLARIDMTWAAVPKAAISASSNAGRRCPLSRTRPSRCRPATQPTGKDALRLSPHQGGRKEAHQDLRGIAPGVRKESGK